MVKVDIFLLGVCVGMFIIILLNWAIDRHWRKKDKERKELEERTNNYWKFTPDEIKNAKIRLLPLPTRRIPFFYKDTEVSLEDQLKEALSKEEYELAAIIRDKISKLKK